MKPLLTLLFHLTLFLVTSLQLSAQDSLAFYLEEAAHNNPALKASYLEYSATLEKIPQSGSLPDPQLQLGYYLKPMELLGGNQLANFQLMQMFPWIGTLKAAKNEARMMASAKFEQFINTRNELYFNIEASYYGLQKILSEIKIAKKNLELLHSLEQLTLIRFSSGSSSLNGESVSNMIPAGNRSNIIGGNMNAMSGTQAGSSVSIAAMTSTNPGGTMNGNGKGDMVNLLRIQLEINNLENQIAQSEDLLISEKAGFNRFLNKPSDANVYIEDSLMERALPNGISELEDSLRNHPMVMMYLSESEANSSKIDMVKHMGYPMIGLGLSYSIIQSRSGNTSMMNGKDMLMPMATITLPVYRKKYKAMKRQAEFMRDAAGESAENTLNNLKVDFQKGLQNLKDADRRIKLYSEQAQLSDRSMQLLINAFSAGGSEFEEILRMEQQLLDFRNKQAEAIADKNIAIAQLIYLTGVHQGGNFQ